MRALVAVILLAPALASAEEDRTSRLERGEILISAKTIEGSSAPEIAAEAVIDAAPEKVWAIVSDCGSYAKTMPRIAAATEEKREGSEVTCRTMADMPFPLGDLEAVTKSIHTVEPGKRWSRQWSLLSGDYLRNSGGWILTPWQGDLTRTHLRYRIHAEPKLSLPQGLINSAQKNALPDLIERLRALTRSP